MHIGKFVRGKGRFVETPFVPTEERTNRRYPLILTTGRILSQYNVGAQTRRTENVTWHPEDLLEIHPYDAEERGVVDGGWVALASRAGETELRAHITDTVPAGRRVHDLPSPGHGRQRRDDRAFRLGDELPGVQGDRRPGEGQSARHTRSAVAGHRFGPGELRRPGLALRSGMARPDLVRMANQIAANFRHHPEAQAAAEVANHIRMFWPALMRRELLDDIGAGGFDPLVVSAAELLRERRPRLSECCRPPDGRARPRRLRTSGRSVRGGNRR